jgi:hypothetical protein
MRHTNTAAPNGEEAGARRSFISEFLRAFLFGFVPDPMKLPSGLVVLYTVAAAGCTDPLAPSRLVDVTITTDRSIVSATQPVELTVTVVNRSSVFVKTGAPGSYCYPPAFMVLDATLRERKPTPRVCAAIGTRRYGTL